MSEPREGDTKICEGCDLPMVYTDKHKCWIHFNGVPDFMCWPEDDPRWKEAS